MLTKVSVAFRKSAISWMGIAPVQAGTLFLFGGFLTRVALDSGAAGAAFLRVIRLNSKGWWITQSLFLAGYRALDLDRYS